MMASKRLSGSAHASLHSECDNREAAPIDTAELVFARIRREAEQALDREPELGAFLFSNVLNHTSLHTAVAHRVAARLSHPALGSASIERAYSEAVERDPHLIDAFRADIIAVFDRDPACTRLMEPLLYFKGYHALQTHRLAYALWAAGRKDFALYLQSRASAVFQTDIHPAARFGKAVFLDHATGFVVGSTAQVEDDVSFLQNVTLGGTGKETGDRHPKIRRGVLIGAGAKILGNIEVGQCARVAAGSVVLSNVPRNTTVAGVPARVVGAAGCAEPGLTMDQILARKALEP